MNTPQPQSFPRETYGYVYRTTNTVNSKTYVGQHRYKADEPWTEYLGSGKIIARAIAKNGPQVFQKELLATATTKEELNCLEAQHIRAEVEAGRGEYNILVGDPSKINWTALSGADEAKVLDWYFEDLLSTREIARLLDCSQPVVVALLAKNKSDARFSRVKERTPLRRRVPSPETLAKIKQTSEARGPQTCSKCGKDFGLWQVRTHERTCGDHERSLPSCPTCGKKLTKKTAKTCRQHRR